MGYIREGAKFSPAQESPVYKKKSFEGDDSSSGQKHSVSRLEGVLDEIASRTMDRGRQELRGGELGADVSENYDGRGLRPRNLGLN